MLNSMIQDPKADEINLQALMETIDINLLNNRIKKLYQTQKNKGCLAIPEGLELQRLVKHK